MRFLTIPLVLALVAGMHLRKKKGKGRHNERAHGAWSPKSSFKSKAKRRKKRG